MTKTKTALLILITVMLTCSLALAGCGGSSASDTPPEPAEWEVFLDEFEEWVERCEKVAKQFEADPLNASIQEEVVSITGTEVNEWKEKIAAQKEKLSEEELELFNERLNELTLRTDAVAKQLKETISANSNSSNSNNSSGSTGSTDWEAFLNEYEAWVDSYVVFMEKYLANPTDMSLLSDYAKMTSDMTEWSKKAEELQTSLTPEEAALYAERLTAITNKLASVAQGLM